MTTVAIHQPDFLPYLGFFKKMQSCDIFLLYDNAQFSKNGYHNRNRIKTPQGKAWITVPVNSPQLRPILSVGIDNARQWGRRVVETLQANYSRAPYFDSFASEFERVFVLSSWEKLVDLNIRLLDLIQEALGLEVKIIRTSSLPEPDSANATGRLIEMTRAVGGNKYLSGSGGVAYLDQSEFRDVALEFVVPPKSSYRQEWGGFVPDLSIVDALFNCGGEARNLLLT